ncbi:MAG: hypothetical protein NTW87_09125 [Planctomycetota bacterium]|nr:hypothetical protein [Planctomycetota bacterium]
MSAGAGFTLAEVLMVALIILILTASVVGGYNSMQKNQRLSNATEKAQSMVHLARSLAIANNAIYHVRIENWRVVGDPDKDDPYADQFIGVYCFPTLSDATKVTLEDSPEVKTRVPGYWNIGATIKDPAVFNHYCVERVRLDLGTYLGIQQDPGATAKSKAVLAFYPDGSASSHMTIFVTDNATQARIRDGLAIRTTLNDFRDPKDQSGVSMGTQTFPDYYSELNRNRISAFNSGNAHIRMIRVLQGGLIKQLVKEPYLKP